MRWLKRRMPNHYEKRNNSGFLLLPKQAFLANVGYQWRWLEYAEWEDEYDGYGWHPSYWKAKP